MIQSTRRREWLPEIIFVVALMLLPLLFWWRLWAPSPADRAVIPEGDFTAQYYPLQLFAARELAAGRLPAWDPYLNAGQPGLADVQTGFFYPPNLIVNLVLALLGRPFTVGLLTVQVVFHFSLASLFTYLFVRQRALLAGARRPAARLAGAVAAIAFAYAGYLTSFPVQQVTILETAVWLPLALFFLDRAAHHTYPLAGAALAGLALGAALLAGHPQTGMYVAYTAVAYGLFLTLVSGSARPERMSAPWWYGLRLVILVLMPLAVGAGVAAVQLGPTLQFIGASTRAGLSYDAVSWGFPLAEVTHLLYPGFFGGSPQYVGLLPPVLAAAACLVPRLGRHALFWFVVAAGAFLLSFGRHTFVYNIAYLLLPGFSVVRNQERIIYLFSLAMAVLAGMGALALVQPLPRQVRIGFARLARIVAWVWVGFVALTALWYAGTLQGQQQGVEVNLFEGVLRHHVLLVIVLGGSALLLYLRVKRPAARGWIAGLALGLIAFNLYTVNWQYNLAAPAAGGAYPVTGVVEFLQAQAHSSPGAWRISSAGLLPGGSSAGIVYRLEDITGNTPLQWERFARFEEQVGSWRRWQLLNVRYVLDTRDLDGPGLERVFEEGDVKVYRVGDPLPRAWIVHNLVEAAGDEALAILDREDFDPKRDAVVVPGADIHIAPVASDADSVRVVEREPGRLVLDVAAGSDGLLVVSQPDYPGWQARVDGRVQPIHRADGLLQGVALPAGSHRVEIAYHLSLVPAIASLVVLLGALALVAPSLRRARPVPRANL
ncbi:MAG: YfhO family protein [Anaerolineae bacterium]|nr:YfhO family protein [Anaerolineae bacterium]